MLTSKIWKISGYIMSKSGYPDLDYYATLPACVQDDVYKFMATQFTLEEGATKCGPQDPQVKGQGFWQFTNNETKIEMNSSNWGQIEKELITLNQTTLKLSYWYTDVDGKILTITETYTAL